MAKGHLLNRKCVYDASTYVLKWLTNIQVYSTGIIPTLNGANLQRLENYLEQLSYLVLILMVKMIHLHKRSLKVSFISPGKKFQVTSLTQQRSLTVHLQALKNFQGLNPFKERVNPQLMWEFLKLIPSFKLTKASAQV